MSSATWVLSYNGGVDWGEVINGDSGMVLDGSRSIKRIESMLFWDVNNGISRSWAM
jgi:urocanate hydratase